MASSKVTDPRPSDDQPKKRSKSAERVALETGVGELKLNVADGEEDLKELEANQEGLESAFDDCLGGGQCRDGSCGDITQGRSRGAQSY